MLLDPTKEEEDDNATEYSKADSAWLNETDDASQMSLDSTRNNEKKKSKKKDKSKDKIKKNEENEIIKKCHNFYLWDHICIK